MANTWVIKRPKNSFSVLERDIKKYFKNLVRTFSVKNYSNSRYELIVRDELREYLRLMKRESRIAEYVMNYNYTPPELYIHLRCKKGDKALLFIKLNF